MAAPNLNSTSLTVKAAMDRVTPGATTEQSLTANAGSSGHTYITLSLTVANTTASGIAIRVNYYDGTNDNHILYDAVVPGNAQIEACPTRKFILEGQTLKVRTPNTTSGITFTHHYLDCN